MLIEQLSRPEVLDLHHPHTSITPLSDLGALDAAVANIPRLNLQVSPEKFFEDAIRVILKFFPRWCRTDLVLEQCKDGLTNKLVKCLHKPSQQVILLRAYGRKSEVIINRSQEIKNLLVLSYVRMGPHLYGRFKNGLVYGYIPGDVLQPTDLCDTMMGRRIAQYLAKWHRVEMPGTKLPQLFPTLRKWLSQIPELFTKEEDQRKFNGYFENKNLSHEIDEMERHLTSLNSPVVFCHNDLLSGNILYNAAQNAVYFIDYEYGCYNYRGFDIGNHFNEWAGFDCDYTLCPDKKTQMAWLREYVNASGNVEIPMTSDDMEQLYREVNHCMPASHIYWGLWALMQAEISTINFDYMDYAILRFSEYYKQKKELLTL